MSIMLGYMRVSKNVSVLLYYFLPNVFTLIVRNIIYFKSQD
jgi:hypothetical protein